MQVLRFHLLELEKVSINLFNSTIIDFAMFENHVASDPTITLTNQGRYDKSIIYIRK